VCQILVFNAINTIATDMEGNIRIDRLPLCSGTDRETDISLASGSGNIISIGRYDDLGQSAYPDIALRINSYYISVDIDMRAY
jgi:hypothetical protein